MREWQPPQGTFLDPGSQIPDCPIYPGLALRKGRRQADSCLFYLLGLLLSPGRLWGWVASLGGEVGNHGSTSLVPLTWQGGQRWVTLQASLCPVGRWKEFYFLIAIAFLVGFSAWTRKQQLWIIWLQGQAWERRRRETIWGHWLPLSLEFPFLFLSLCFPIY